MMAASATAPAGAAHRRHRSSELGTLVEEDRQATSGEDLPAARVGPELEPVLRAADQELGGSEPNQPATTTIVSQRIGFRLRQQSSTVTVSST